MSAQPTRGPILPIHHSHNAASPDRASGSSQSTLREEKRRQHEDSVAMRTRAAPEQRWPKMVMLIEMINTAALVMIAVAAGYVCWFLAKAGKGI